MLNMKWVLLTFFMFVSFHSSCIQSQQQYVANEIFNCTNKSLYTCNRQQKSSCTSFLIFKSQPPYNSVPTIAALMSSNPSQLAQINNSTKTTVFPHGKEIIVPVNCSCSRNYYQANTHFHIEPQLNTYFIIANNSFQGLSTCGSLEHANHYGEFDLEDGFVLNIPLRCACPTKKQVLSGTKFLLTYPINFGDSFNYVSRKFNVTEKSVLKANRLSENSSLYPFTTLLIPLPAKPSISETIIQRYKTEAAPVYPSAKRLKVKKTFKVRIVAVCSSLVITFVVVTVLGVLYVWRKQNKETIEDKMLPEELHVKIASFERIVKVFSFKELLIGTENFANKRRIKGSVYYGVFGSEILVVKKMCIDVCKQVNMLSKINHINLVKLYGFCKHQDSWYLVFEYMKMGSLKDWITGQRLEESYTFCKRVKIAIDVAIGLHYLHNFTNPGYVHNNINSSNILLDGNLRAKISNFSLSRTRDNGNDDSALGLITTKIVGTRGYMAPEYVGSGCITSKVDVFSFGVVMLELITGKSAVFRDGGHEVFLATAMARIMEGDDAESEIRCMVGFENEEKVIMEYAVQVVKLSLMCVKQDLGLRPSMDEVVSSLVKILVDLETIVDPCKTIDCDGEES